MVSVTVKPSPHWVNAWVLKFFTRGAYVSVDNARVSLIPWNQEKQYELTSGPHSINFYFAYRGVNHKLGKRDWIVTPTGGEFYLIKNGVSNQSPFYLYERHKGKIVEDPKKTNSMPYKIFGALSVFLHVLSFCLSQG